jgi:hypothetical protein
LNIHSSVESNFVAAANPAASFSAPAIRYGSGEFQSLVVFVRRIIRAQ